MSAVALAKGAGGPMPAGAVRIYADASVFGGVFDEEFAGASDAFFRQVRAGRFALVSSTLVRRELQPAPEDVRALFGDLQPIMEISEVSEEALRLGRAYLDEGIISGRWADDAMHVALATAAGCPVIVSWNFRHIVHRRKIPLYNAVNTLRGHPGLAIHSPREVIEYAEEDL